MKYNGFSKRLHIRKATQTVGQSLLIHIENPYIERSSEFFTTI